jgi:hypothetical protein
VYLALYTAARNSPRIPGLRRPAEFYLNAALQTLYAANCRRPDGAGFDCVVTVGLMDGTVFRELLRALQAEGPDSPFAPDATVVSQLMRSRTLGGGGVANGGWNGADNPAGSEFAWDTTGQEEVAVWGAWFDASDDGWMHGELNDRTVDSILAYMAPVPTWAHSGAAYGMGDFSNNGLWMVTNGWEREGGHYRAGLNSIPVIERYRAHPDDFHLLLTGVAGITAVTPNLGPDGAPSMAFHTHPFIMEHDPHSGDHGLGWFGASLNSGSYLHSHVALGRLLCFLCDVQVTAAGGGSVVTVLPRDLYRARAYLEPLGLWLVAEAGLLANVTMDYGTGTVAVAFEPSAAAAAAAGMPADTPPYDVLRLRFEQAAPAVRPWVFRLLAPAGAQLVRGAWAFPPAAGGGVTTAVIGFSHTS